MANMMYYFISSIKWFLYQSVTIKLPPYLIESCEAVWKCLYSLYIWHLSDTQPQIVCFYFTNFFCLHKQEGAVHILGKICPRSDPDVAHMEYSMDPLKLFPGGGGGLAQNASPLYIWDAPPPGNLFKPIKMHYALSDIVLQKEAHI